MSARPHLILIGGFLGAGKTTLILAAARRLAERGLRSAAIMNDQGDNLVDTQFVESNGLDAREVTGGCFCCRFSELVERADELRAHAPDVIFAEPVGSCTDIYATTILPLRTEYAGEYRMAPFTVLVDPARAHDLLQADADPDLSFLFRKQLEEADLICLTKSDLQFDAPDFPYANVRRLSAKSGEGVEAWLDEVLAGQSAVAGRVLDIDYEHYARAEAALAWLNLDVAYRPHVPCSPAAAIGPLLDNIDRKLTAAGIAIVHLKMTDQSDSGFLKAAICSNGAEPSVQGALDASPASRHELRLNLRAVGDPEIVRAIVESEFDGLRGALDDLRVACFRPAPPKPEHRMVALS